MITLMMDDRDLDGVKNASAELKTLFNEFNSAHDAVVLTLEDRDAIETAVKYYDAVFDKYRSIMSKIRTFTVDPERVLEPLHPQNDSAMTSSFVQAHELPRIEITTPAVIMAHDVLVGQLENSAAVKPLDVSSAHEDKPVALLTVLGSTLKGPVPPQPSCARVTSHLISSSVTKKKQIADPSHHNKLSRVEGDNQRFDVTSSDVGILISRGLSRLQFVLLLFLCCSVSAFASSQCAAHSGTSFKFQGGGVLFPRNNCVFFPYLNPFFNLLLFELLSYLYPSKSNALYYTLFILP